MNEIINLSRRDFLKTGALLGGGLILGFTIPFQGSPTHASTGSPPPFIPNAFIRIGTDDTVTIIVNKSEMGQGVYTSLPMLVAEELEVDWSRVRIEAAPVDPAYNHTQWGVQGTGGSTSVRTSWDQLLKAGATARVMLITAGAATWGVEPATCRAEKGSVIHETTKRRLSYGQLAERAARLAPPADVPLKPPQAYTLIGKPIKRLDTPEKITGKALFGLDVRVPGMLTAVVARPPVFGATVKSVNDVKAKAVPGVKGVVRIDSGVAVVADHFWAAKGGRDALEVVWDEGPLATLDSKSQREEYAKLAGKQGVIAARRGDVEAALAGAAKRIDAVYEVPYLAHAPMEPLNCVAHVRADGCDIWTGTQMQTGDRDAAARLTGLPPDKVKLHTMLLGGGFGRRAVGDAHFVREAVQVSMAVQAPVKVVWTREDDIRGGYYRPVVYNLIRAGLGDDGMPVAWHHRIVGQSILIGTPFQGGMKDGLDPTQVEGAADSPYEVPNFLVDYHMAPAGVPVLWWRSVGHTFTAFVKEGFIDELAHLAGKDPYQYRRQLLAKHPRQRALLDLVAAKAGWGKRSAPDRFQGIAVHESFGSFVAQVAEVSVSPTGLVRVHRVVCAIDCGRIVNPDTIVAQIESGIVFGLTAALHGEITFKDGRVEQSNFHDYEVLRINDMPQVEVHIMPSQESPGGVGEPGVPPIAPAVVNAVYAATGKRIRRLPIRPGELRRA
jgi:isoquinoline 1-oxidoreductase beta subunit